MTAELDSLTHPAGTPDNAARWLDRYTGSLLNVFGTPQRVLVRGQGAHVWDDQGRRYLDLLGGIAVNALGHAHPFVTSVIASQLATLGHVSNFFTSPTQVALAERLLEISGAPGGSKVFFANSGTEANEAAFKLARAHGNADNSGRRTKILALDGAFHGRSMGALALTAKKAYREPFEPMPGGVEHIAFNDVDALDDALDDTVAALVIEPIQGEAGVRPLSPEYLRKARELTRAAGALLIVDEVQTGIGRTGSWLAYPDIAGTGPDDLPDAITLAKGLGSGFPIGAMITVGARASSILSPGQHGTTFGGNPVASAAALATLHTLDADGVLNNAATVGDHLREKLAALDHVTAVRGRGLLIAFDLDAPASAALVTRGLDAGYIVNAPGPSTIRLAPPLILTTEQADDFLTALPALIEGALADTNSADTTEGA